MNMNQLTQKSLAAIQQAQNIAVNTATSRLSRSICSWPF